MLAQLGSGIVDRLLDAGRVHLESPHRLLQGGHVVLQNRHVLLEPGDVVFQGGEVPPELALLTPHAGHRLDVWVVGRLTCKRMFRSSSVMEDHPFVLGGRSGTPVLRRVRACSW